MRWPTTGRRPDQARNRLCNCSRDTRRAQQGKDAKLTSIRLDHDEAVMVSANILIAWTIFLMQDSARGRRSALYLQPLLSYKQKHAYWMGRRSAA